MVNCVVFVCSSSVGGQLWCDCVLAVAEVNCGVFVCLCACSGGGQLWCVCVLAVAEVNCGVFMCLQ